MLESCGKVNVLAMHQRHDLASVVAHCMRAEDSLLYVCVHNPMTDLSIIEMKELLTKASVAIVLVVILPVLGHLEGALQVSCTMRLHANSETRYVATYADLDEWLSLFGILNQTMLTLPCHKLEFLHAD